MVSRETENDTGSNFFDAEWQACPSLPSSKKNNNSIRVIVLSDAGQCRLACSK
jgi:hypothetical protein